MLRSCCARIEPGPSSRADAVSVAFTVRISTVRRLMASSRRTNGFSTSTGSGPGGSRPAIVRPATRYMREPRPRHTLGYKMGRRIGHAALGVESRKLHHEAAVGLIGQEVANGKEEEH